MLSHFDHLSPLVGLPVFLRQRNRSITPFLQMTLVGMDRMVSKPGNHLVHLASPRMLIPPAIYATIPALFPILLFYDMFIRDQPCVNPRTLKRSLANDCEYRIWAVVWLTCNSIIQHSPTKIFPLFFTAIFPIHATIWAVT